jgi:hypothetical protein
MLFRKNLTVCSKPLTFEMKKIETQEIDQNLLIRLRRGGAVVPRLPRGVKNLDSDRNGRLDERYGVFQYFSVQMVRLDQVR